MYYPKVLTTDTEKPFSYLQSSFFIVHLPDKYCYNWISNCWSSLEKEKNI